MRILTSAVAAAALLAFQATPGLSQTTPQEPAPPAATAPAAPAPAAPAPGAATPETTTPETTAPATTPAPVPHKAPRHAKRMTLHQRFEAANAAKDGHLTLEEANAAKWTYVSRHFQAMDKDHKGYVTEADIHAYARAQHAARRAAKQGTQAPATTAPAPSPAAPSPAAPAPGPAAPAQQ